MIKVIPLRNGTLMFPRHLTRVGAGWRDKRTGNVIPFPTTASVVPLPTKVRPQTKP